MTLCFKEVREMRYFFKKPEVYSSIFGKRYNCDHPVYNECTLYIIDNRGLAVIQQQYDPETKYTFWTSISSWLTDKIYLHPRFRKFFDTYADREQDGLYPTVTVRQIMWGLRMKPLPKEPWETCFDRKGF